MAMAATVSDVLTERARTAQVPAALVGFVSLAVHAGFVALLAVASSPRPRPFVPMSLAVRVVSPGSLARPAAAVRPAAPVAAPPAEEPRKRPVIEKIRPDAPPKPSEKALPLPEAKRERKPEPVPAPSSQKGESGGAAAAGEALELPSAGGGGEAANGLSFGASVASFDADFPFAYYAEQLQALIGANWLKPNVPEGTACVVTFTILRSGQVTEVKNESSSGLAFFDRAAARAVYSANPLPPLPPEFRGERLGVRIRFQ